MDALRRKIQNVGIKLKITQEDYCEFLGCSRSNLYNITGELTVQSRKTIANRTWIPYDSFLSENFEKILLDAYHLNRIQYHTRLLSNYSIWK